ncbi:MAG: helix-turn-helix transcriptional regulator [Phycisphaerae bacterium]|nr:helix-turn-helix transcriptional regulator [Phycisphaerae bacterium]
MKDIMNPDFLRDQEFQKLCQQEKLILDVTEAIAKLMEQQKISRVDLAKKIDRHKTYITRLLDGTANMTLRTISDVLYALDTKLLIETVPLNARVVLKTKVNVAPLNVANFKSRECNNWKMLSYPECYGDVNSCDELLAEEMVA